MDKPADSSFVRALALEPAAGAETFAAHLHADWLQGPGVYGGLQAALLLAAQRERLGRPDFAARSLHVDFVRRARPGPAIVEVETVRIGRGAAQLRATLRDADGAVVALGNGVFGAARGAGLAADPPPPMPAISAFSQTPVARHGAGPPRFTQHLEFRDALGGRVYGGHRRAHLGGWGRFVEATPLDDAAVVALLDAWPPAVLAKAHAQTPVASITMTVQFAPPPPPFDGAAAAGAPADAVVFEASGRLDADGYFDEDATLWRADGVWLASARQRVVTFAAGGRAQAPA